MNLINDYCFLLFFCFFGLSFFRFFSCHFWFLDYSFFCLMMVSIYFIVDSLAFLISPCHNVKSGTMVISS